MKFNKLLYVGLMVSTLLSGCSFFNKDVDSIEIAPVPVVDNSFHPEKKWSVSVGSGSESFYSILGPTVQDYHVYAASRSGLVKSIELYGGKEKWRLNLADKRGFFIPHDSALLSGGLTVYGDRLFVGSERGIVYAIDSQEGKLLWQNKVAGEVLSKPVVTSNDGVVLVHTSNGQLQALNIDDGSIKWSSNIDVGQLTLRGESTPAISHGAAVVGDDNGRVKAYFVENGQLIWQQKISQPKGTTEIDLINDVDVSPIIDGDTVYATGYNGNLVGLDLRTGQMLWKKELGSARDFIVYNGRVFVVDQGDGINAYAITANTVLWKNSELLNRQLTAPVLYQGLLVFGDYQGYLYWIDPLDGTIIAEMHVDSSGFLSTPVVADDMLIIQAKKGTVYAISRY